MRKMVDPWPCASRGKSWPHSNRAARPPSKASKMRETTTTTTTTTWICPGLANNFATCFGVVDAFAKRTRRVWDRARNRKIMAGIHEYRFIVQSSNAVFGKKLQKSRHGIFAFLGILGGYPQRQGPHQIQRQVALGKLRIAQFVQTPQLNPLM